MRSTLRHLLLVSALAAISLPALSRPDAPPEADPTQRRAAMREHFEGHLARRATDLRERLGLTPEQESAWTDYLAALRPGAAINPEALAAMTTPERLDKLREMHQQRAAAFERRDHATRAFYAKLSPTQQKTFDEETSRLFANWRGHRPR